MQRLATSSLPVPLSPVTSTVVSVSATRVTSSHIFFIAGLSPSMSSNALHAVHGLAQALHLLAERAVLERPLEVERELVDVERLRHEVVGARADGRDGRLHAPNAVMTMTGVSSRRATSSRHSSTPLMPTKFTSVMTRSKSSRSNLREGLLRRRDPGSAGIRAL